MGAGSPSASRRNQPCQHLAFGLPASTIVRELIRVTLKPLVCGVWLWQVPGPCGNLPSAIGRPSLRHSLTGECTLPFVVVSPCPAPIEGL